MMFPACSKQDTYNAGVAAKKAVSISQLPLPPGSSSSV